MIHSRDDYSTCYGCCPCSLKVGIILIAASSALQGLIYFSDASVQMSKAFSWVSLLNIIFGFLWCAVAVYALVSLFKRNSAGVRSLGFVFKAAAVFMLISDIILIIDMFLLIGVEGSSDFYVLSLVLLAWHVACYINIYWVLGTIKSTAAVLSAGGRGDEKKNYLELGGANSMV